MIFDLLLQEFPVYGAMTLFVFGSIMGSFIHCMGYRVAVGMSLRYPPSQCGSCKRTLKAIDLIPVVSYIIFRGKCRKCSAHFSVIYVVIEVLAGAGYVAIYWVLKNFTWASITVAFWWLALFAFSFLLHKKIAIQQE